MAFLNENGAERLWRHTLESYVPLTRTINNKSLDTNITLTAGDVGALSLSGGTIQGQLRTYGYTAICENANSNFISAHYYSYNWKKQASWQINFANQPSMYALIYGYNSTSNSSPYYEKYTFPLPDAELAGNVSYKILTSKERVTIEEGGTNATTPEEARQNLGVFASTGGVISGDTTVQGVLTANVVIGAVYQ